MKKYLISWSLLVMLLATGCESKNEPSVTTPEKLAADFSYIIKQPYGVRFYNRSSASATGFLWDFGDGTTSELQSPYHHYTTKGQYIVTLTANRNSEKTSARQTIKIETPHVLISGIRFTKVGKQNMYYRVNIIDDDVITTWKLQSKYTPLLSNSLLPYTLSGTVEMTELDGDNYYTVYVYWSSTTNGNGTQILKKKMMKTDIMKYPEEITLTNDNNDTQVQILFSYR